MVRRSYKFSAALAVASSILLTGIAAPVAVASPAGSPGASGRTHRGQDHFVFELATGRPSTRVLARGSVKRSLITASGQTQWISCRGPNLPTAKSLTAPTVVLVAGLGAGHQYWNRVRPLLLPTSRVCWYDRPGLGYSPSRRGKRVATAAQARELAALLTAAGEKGRFVLAGHSYGGLLVRSFAYQFPGRTAGMVLVDASYSTQWRYSGKYWSEGGARINMKRTEHDVYGRPQLGSKPLIVLGAGKGNSAQWQRMQAVAATLSKNSVHVTARRSTHVIMASNPRIVATAIGQALIAAATSTKLTPCASNLAKVWAPLGGFCGRRK